jgi:hypothetical protein
MGNNRIIMNLIKPEETQFEKELVELGFIKDAPDYYKCNIYLWGLIKENGVIGYYLQIQRRDKFNPYKLIEINKIEQIIELIRIL